MPERVLVLVSVSMVLLGAGCDCGGAPPGGRARDAGTGRLDAPSVDAPFVPIDAGPDTGPRDAYLAPNPDAFFFADPPPEICYPDGGMGPWPDPPGGTPECPDDRRREGCRCDTIGAREPCWPGPRRNRNRGICMDGTAECIPYDEFGGAWGPCEGAVLPVPGVELGPNACECFSMGRWAIDNLSPCFVDYGGGSIYAVSTFIGAGGMAACPTTISPTPPPAPEPGQPWSTNRLTVDCEGHFELCYTLRAGSATTPSPTDCVVARVCTEAWYEVAGVAQEFPVLPGWTSTNPTCSAAFQNTGGYGEMSVLGFSRECDDIDDGMGGEYVFNRVNYCPIRCNTMPTLPECMGCMMGGSGGF